MRGDLLDVHAAFAGGDHRDAAARAIDQDGKIQFASDVAAGLDIDAMHGPAGGPGLFRYKDVADHGVGGRLDLIDGAREAHAALAVRVIGETTGAASSGVDLRFYHEDRAGEFRGGGGGFVRGPCDV